MPHAVERPFRVIIVGAGVSGLVLAHALERAKIDFVVLEKGIVAPPWGTSITMVPAGARLLHQIGILDAVERRCTPMKDFCVRSATTGETVLQDRWFDAMREKLGYPDLTLERREFLQILYDELPDKSKVQTGKKVKHVIDNDDEAGVELADGSIEHADIVVGCDGVHSTVRDSMWANANRSIPGYISKKEQETMLTTYGCLLGIAPMQPGLGKNDMTFVCNKGYTFQFLTQPDAIYFMIHHKLPEPVRWPNKLRYTDKDAEEMAAKFADHPISDTLRFGDLWQNRVRGHLISLEEGVLEHFFFGRTVVIGDAAHKVTPNAAMGGASAMEDSVALANAIHSVARSQTGRRPSKKDVTDTLQQYQDERKPRLKKIHDESAFVTRLQSYDTWFLYLLMRWILPLIGLGPIVHSVSKLGSQGPRLKYVTVDEQQGTIPWLYPQPKTSTKAAIA